MNILEISRGNTKIPLEAVETFILNISKHMSKMGHAVTIVDRLYSSYGSSIECINDLKIMKLNVPQISLRRIQHLHTSILLILHEFNTILFALGIRIYLANKADCFDVIHVHTPLIGVVLAILNRLRSKMIYTSHSNIWALSLKHLTFLQRISLILESYLMRLVRKVFVPYESLKSTLISVGQIKAEKVEVISHGVDIEFFKPNIDVTDIKKKYGLRRVSILFVGRLARSKGVEYLIKAANILVNDFGYKNALFLIVGSLPSAGIDKPVDMRALVNFIRTSKLEDNVTFLGSVPLEDLRKLYVACDVFVLPSLFDLSPRAAAEAMSSGKPVIAARVGALLTQIKDGYNGFLVDPANEKQLAHSIKYLIDNPMERDKIGANARKYAEEEFDERRIAEKYLLLLDIRDGK